jgi:hypothetical protein
MVQWWGDCAVYLKALSIIPNRDEKGEFDIFFV